MAKFKINDIIFNAIFYEITNGNFYKILEVKENGYVLKSLKSNIIRHPENSSACKFINIDTHYRIVTSVEILLYGK